MDWSTMLCPTNSHQRINSGVWDIESVPFRVTFFRKHKQNFISTLPSEKCPEKQIRMYVKMPNNSMIPGEEKKPHLIGRI